MKEAKGAWEMNIDEVYRAYFAQVYRYALYLTKDQNEAEDVTQETFFKAIHHIEQFRGESDIRVWLFRIAENIFCDRLRKQKNYISVEQLDETPSGRDPEKEVLARDAALRAMEAFHKLEQPYRTVFSMRTFGEFSHADIGKKLGKSENWARVTYYRAKRKLQEEMKHEGYM